MARRINIPFCVAGGIRTVADARAILNDGADKISVNSPALENPDFITELADAFGTQCVVVGIDSRLEEHEDGSQNMLFINILEMKPKPFPQKEAPLAATEAQRRGAGEIVLNCMNNDGVKRGYDLDQLRLVRDAVNIQDRSGGAGDYHHFADLFETTGIDGGLAASVFHSGQIPIPDLKSYLQKRQIEVRL